MIANYLISAWRNIFKNRLYAIINVFGLALGLTVYFLGGVLANYEKSHDTMFANHERTYTIGSLLSPNANVGVKEFDTTYTAVGPHLEAGVPNVEAMARTVRRNYLMTVEDNSFYEQLRFADASLLQIFDFTYIAGSADALQSPDGLLVTRSMANKLFGRIDVMGETVELDHEHVLRVTAVIEDVPQNSHFNSNIISNNPLSAVAPLPALNRIAEYDLAGNWNNISLGNLVYVMLEKERPLDEFDRQINEIFNAHASEDTKEMMVGLRSRPLEKTNTAIWDMVGMPVIESIQIMGALVLLIAIVNYTNLAMAQSMRRTREVGIRKTHGATRFQLLNQFLIESFAIAAIAVALSLVALELIVPQFNGASGKVVSLDYMSLLPWLLGTTFVVGLLAGLYPSYLITKVRPIDTLSDKSGKRTGGFFRASMIGIQFLLAIFMLAFGMIMFFQNQKVLESSNIFPKDEVIALERLSTGNIVEREQLLRSELLKLADVRTVSFATQIPFEQSNNMTDVTRVKGDTETKFSTNTLSTDHDFLKTFDIPLVAGRDFSREISADERTDEEVRSANVIINELLATKLGFASANEAVDQIFWSVGGDQEPFQYRVIGVVESQNILGLHNDIKPWIFSIDPTSHFYGAIRLKAGASATVIDEIEAVWKEIIPDYPIRHQFLDGLFEGVYSIYRTMNTVLAAFAGFALLLAFIGLFGLAAFMAETRTKEIGLRKVLGATSNQIVRLLVWQFSKPVMWAIVLALPLVYFTSGIYLEFFADRISTQVPIIVLAGVMAVAVAWSVIAVHAVTVARRNPITALRYE